MYNEMVIWAEGDYFWTDGKQQEEISEGQAIDFLVRWEMEGKQVNEMERFHGLVRQFWVE